MVRSVANAATPRKLDGNAAVPARPQPLAGERSLPCSDPQRGVRDDEDRTAVVKDGAHHRSEMEIAPASAPSAPTRRPLRPPGSV